jgi:hypothetical protein
MIALLLTLAFAGFGATVKAAKTSASFPAFRAVETNDAEQLQKYIKKGGDVNARLEDGRSLLHVAASLGHDKMIDLLLRAAKIDLTVRDRNGETVLFAAVRTDRVAIVKRLTEAGANPSWTDKVCNSAIHEAAGFRAVKSFDYLVTTTAKWEPDPECKTEKPKKGTLEQTFTSYHDRATTIRRGQDYLQSLKVLAFFQNQGRFVPQVQPYLQRIIAMPVAKDSDVAQADLLVRISAVEVLAKHSKGKTAEGISADLLGLLGKAVCRAECQKGALPPQVNAALHWFRINRAEGARLKQEVKAKLKSAKFPASLVADVR